MLVTARAELGAVRWAPVLGAVCAAVVLAGLDLAGWPQGPGSLLAWVSAGLLGGAAALLLDDPAAAITRSVPPSLARRTALRLGVAVVLLAAWAGYAAGLPGSWPAAAAVGAAMLLAGAGLTAVLRDDASGSTVAAALVLGVLGLAVVPLPGELAPYDVSAAWSETVALWLVVGVSGLGGLVWGVRRP